LTVDHALLARARSEAISSGHRLLERLRHLELSAPVADIAEADRQEWWCLVDVLNIARLQVALLNSLGSDDGLARSYAATVSSAYRHHRQVVAEVLQAEVPETALLIVGEVSLDGESCSGWIPAYDDSAWAVALTRFDPASDALDSTLTHELVHLTQPFHLTAVSDDKALQFLLAEGNDALIEGAVHVLASAILPADDDDPRAAEATALCEIAAYLDWPPLQFARQVGASEFPLEFVAELLGDDLEELAWQVVDAVREERERLQAIQANAA